MTTFAAEFADVSKAYRVPLRPDLTVPALRGVSFGVGRGEVLGVVGPNRAGKSTLVKILLGLCRPGGGRVLRLGRPLTDRGTLAHVGYMHENQAFPNYLTPAGLLEFYGDMTWVPPAALKRRAAALLERVGLADRARDPIARFSKGMVQRLALAQALIGEPELLVLDEPMEGLDLDARLLLREVIAEQRGAGKSVLIVSHALDEVAQVCDRVAVLVEGRLVHHGPVASLLHDPDTGGGRSLEGALRAVYRS
jgi:ABC-2 type transport system ATP-binding protein